MLKNTAQYDAEFKGLGYTVTNSVSTSHIKVKEKSVYKTIASGVLKVIAYPTFCSMK